MSVLQMCAKHGVVTAIVLDSSVDLGAKAEANNSKEDSGMSFEDVSDFVLVYRVVRVNRNNGESEAQVYTLAATIVAYNAQESAGDHTRISFHGAHRNRQFSA